MLNFFKNIFSVPKTAQTVVEGAISGIDKLFFTDEEKADAQKEIHQIWLDAVKATAQESSAKSLTRRYLAIIIMGSFIFMLFLAIGFYKIDIEYSKFILLIAKELSTLVLGVGFFYFGYYAVSNILGKK